MPGITKKALAAFVFAAIAIAVKFWIGAENKNLDSMHDYPNFTAISYDKVYEYSNINSENPYKISNKRPCESQESREESELCAQWRSQEAAQQAANWSWWQMIFSGAGVFGLAITLWFNLEAWSQARESRSDTERALKASEENARAALRLADTAEFSAKKELRSYLDFDGVTLKREIEFDGVGSDEIGLKLLIRIRNYGKTPAEYVEATVQSSARMAGQNSLQKVHEDDRKQISTIAPSDEFKIQFYWRVNSLIFNAIKDKNLICRIGIIVTYCDVFSDRHVLRGEFEGLGFVEELGIVEGTRATT